MDEGARPRGGWKSWWESSWWLVVAAFAFLGFLLWCVVVAMTAKGASWWGTWNYETTGQLGDSFGVVSAVMTTAAAIFTARTLSDARRQTRLAEDEAAARRDEAEGAKAAAKRALDEQTFFRLLDQRREILGQVSCYQRTKYVHGPDAVQGIVTDVLNQAQGGMTMRESYLRYFDRHEDDLGNYFRFTYHIVKFCADRFDDDAYSYVRFLRAQMTGSEQALLALNCTFAAGAGSFEKYVNDFSLLHEMPTAYRQRFPFFEGVFHEKAFDPHGRAEIVAPLYPRGGDY